MDNQFSIVSNTIAQRRTIKPQFFTGEKVPDEQVRQLLALADWAPTHGMTEPWRFVVYAGTAVQSFCSAHASLYKANTPAENFVEGTFNNLTHMGDKASHVIIAIMRRGDLPKIPVLEEIASTACAVQNLLLGAQALDIAAYWGTGGMTLKPALKEFLHLREEDQVIGVLYLGKSNEQPVGKRNVPLEQKITWHG